jgi:radical SAM protein with 4Fe4S-binding SPASM domain
MQIATVENALFSITINPLLGFLISCANKVCPRVSEINKIIGLAKQLVVRFMYFLFNKQRHCGRQYAEDDFEETWDNHPLLWKLRVREDLEDYVMDGKRVGCVSCPDRYICGGCRARAYSCFNGDIRAQDIGCIYSEPLWEKIVK